MSATRALKKLEPSYSTKEKVEWLKNIYNTGLKLTGHSTPQQRLATKEIMRILDDPDFSESDVWSFWEQVWSICPSLEEKNLALHFWTNPKNYGFAKKKHKKLLSWARNIENWVHSDYLSSLYAKFYEDPDLYHVMDEVLDKWNLSKNPWLVRQSLVSNLYYAGFRKKTPPIKKVLSRVKAHLDHDHYYVQKAIGWTLREAYQVDMKKADAFIRKHIHDIDTRAYSAAVEKYPKTQKDKLREKRKKHRTSAT